MLTKQAHKMCFNFYDSVPLPAYHQALVCGTALPQDSFQSQLLQIGLIHMLVVSGAHLGFLRNFFRWLRVPKIVISALLSIYILLTGAQAPVVRAWLQRFSPMPSRLSRICKTRVVCLSIFGFSISLLLSWIATLGICWPGVRSGWRQALLIYFFMIPALLSLGTQHPLSILWNLIAATVLGWLLLPLSMIAPLHPWVGFVSEWAWNVFLFLTRRMALLTPAWDVQFQISWFWPWLYLFFLQWLALRKEQSYLRAQLR